MEKENKNIKLFKAVRAEFIPILAKRMGEHSAHIVFEHARGIAYKTLGVKSGYGLEMTEQTDKAVEIVRNVLTAVVKD